MGDLISFPTGKFNNHKDDLLADLESANVILSNVGYGKEYLTALKLIRQKYNISPKFPGESYMLTKDVHTEHCDVNNGCQYGDSDGCSVAAGYKIQSFLFDDDWL